MPPCLASAALGGGGTYLRRLVRHSWVFHVAEGVPINSSPCHSGTSSISPLIRAARGSPSAHPPPLERVATSATAFCNHPNAAAATAFNKQQLLRAQQVTTTRSTSNNHARAIASTMAAKRDFGRAFDSPVGFESDQIAAEPQVCLSSSLFV